MRKVPRILTKEELKGYTHWLTVGKLKEFIEKHNVPDEAMILVQRVEDIYYEENSWGVYLKEGYHSASCRRHNEKVTSGVYDDKEQYPMITEENKKLFTEEEILQQFGEQYHPAWCPVYYFDDKDDFLFLDLHY
jgi:hypothetical protein